MLNRFRHGEEGATAVLVASALLLLMGFAAIAIDYGLGINERRQDQNAADLGVMAGAVDFLSGETAITNGILEYVWENLPSAAGVSWTTDTTYRDAFRSCTDPDAAGFGLMLSPVSEPVNGVWDGTGDGTGDLPCITISPLGYARVRVPDQLIDAPFGRVLGFDTITTSASAIAQIAPKGSGGILPFGLTSTTLSGAHICLSSASGGLAEPPCDGPVSGNFGTLRGRQFGNPEMGTSANCNSSPTGDTLATNIAVGLDHFITIAPNASVADEVRDECFNFGVNTLITDTGFPNNGVEEGLVGPIPAMAPAGTQPLLLQSSNTTSLFGIDIDDKPLWEYIDSGASGIPGECARSTFDNSSGYAPVPWPYATAGDWNDDGVVDTLESWEHMDYCLKEYVSSGSSGTLFLGTIADSPRFGYTPHFFENSLGNGTDWRHIQRFTVVWLQGTFWKRGGNWSIHHPGEGCDTSNGGSCASNEDLKQLSAFTIPDDTLNEDLQGDPPPWGSGVNPYQILLYR